jgi:hypothetical protein
MGIPMNTHVIPMCSMGAENEKYAYLLRKRRKAGKLHKNTHKYPCIKKKQESRYKNQDANKLKLPLYPPPAITAFSDLLPN